MNISAVNMNNQAFKATFHKGDKASNELPTKIAKDVPDSEVVYYSNDGGMPIPYTAGQFRAQQAAREAIAKMEAEAPKAPQPVEDDVPDHIKYLRD